MDVVRAAAHLVEPRGLERALLQRLADHRVEPDLVVLLAVVQPVLGAAVVLGHHARRAVGELGLDAAFEHRRGLHEVVVDRDQRDVTLLLLGLGEPFDDLGLPLGLEEALAALDLVEADGTGHADAPALTIRP